MTTAFPNVLVQQIKDAGIIATLTIEDARHAVPLAHVLLAGGVNILELTLRTPAALEALRLIRAEVPEAVIGAGTILTPQQVNECAEAGAAFGVAPGMNRRVVDEARRIGLPFAPGICTPSDIEAALEAGCTLMKFFPAEPSGGLRYLRSIAAPYQHLGVSFIPLGGLNAENAAQYLAEPTVPALGGSWLASPDLIRREDWPTITTNARIARALVQESR